MIVLHVSLLRPLEISLCVSVHVSLLGHRSHTRISYDYHRIACDRLSQGIFSLARLKNVQLAACYSSFSSKSVCKTITVDGERKGVRGGKCSKAYNKQSIILNYQVCCDKTSGGCYIHTHCPQLPANVTATLSPPIGRMDSMIYDERDGVCVGGGGTSRHVCGQVRLPPVPTRLPPRSPPRMARLTGPVRSRNTDRRIGGWPGMRRRSLIAGVRLHTKTLLQYHEQFHAVTK